MLYGAVYKVGLQIRGRQSDIRKLLISTFLKQLRKKSWKKSPFTCVCTLWPPADLSNGYRTLWNLFCQLTRLFRTNHNFLNSISWLTQIKIDCFSVSQIGNLATGFCSWLTYKLTSETLIKPPDNFLKTCQSYAVLQCQEATQFLFADGVVNLWFKTANCSCFIAKNTENQYPFSKIFWDFFSNCCKFNNVENY